jgi:hypothetical protein
LKCWQTSWTRFEISPELPYQKSILVFPPAIAPVENSGARSAEQGSFHATPIV